MADDVHNGRPGSLQSLLKRASAPADEIQDTGPTKATAGIGQRRRTPNAASWPFAIPFSSD